MAQSDFTDLTGILNSATVKRVATAAMTPPAGGGSFVLGMRSLVVATGVVASFYNGAGFAPYAKGGVISAALKRGISGGDEGFAPMIFLNLQGTAVASNGYLLGLSDAEPSHLVLKKGPMSTGLPDDAPGTNGVIWRSTLTYERDTWVHCRLMAAWNADGDVVLTVYTNDLDTHDVDTPTWVALPGAAIDGAVVPVGLNGLTDDAAGIVTGSASYAGGRAGFGVYVSDTNRVVAFDQIAIEAQT